MLTQYNLNYVLRFTFTSCSKHYYKYRNNEALLLLYGLKEGCLGSAE